MILMVTVGILIWLSAGAVIALGLGKCFARANLRAAAMVKPPVRMYVDPVFVKQQIALMEDALKKQVGSE
jgi:hypothetical protein